VKDKILLGVLLSITLFPWEIWSLNNNPYVDEGIIEQLLKNPRNIVLSLWFILYGWRLVLKAYLNRRYMPVWLITGCVIASAQGINEILRFLVWLSFALSGPILIRNIKTFTKYLRAHYFLSLLSLPSLSIPFSGFNENPNRYARDLVYDYKYGRISILFVLPMVIISESRGALIFLAAFIVSQFVRSRRLLLTVLFISALIPLIYISDTDLTSGRNLAWASGISGFLRNPFFGNGWIDVLDYLWNSGVPSTNFHNAWIEVLFRFGILGLISMLWLLSRARLIWLFPFLILGNVESFLFGYSMDSLLFWGIIFYEKKGTIH
jgi:hypothetical protein